MAYPYYCVDCGRKFKGENISFNLSRMLELERGDKGTERAHGIDAAGDYDDPLTLYATWEELCRYIVKSGVAYAENQETRLLRITLEDVMELFARNAKDSDTGQKIREMEIENIWEGEFVKDLRKDSSQSDSDMQKDAVLVGRRMEANFKKRESGGKEAEDPCGEKKNYYKEVLVLPEYMGNSDGMVVYTLRYTSSLNERNMESFRYGGKEIRGYCPCCHAPVLLGTGKYRHLLIGFIGSSRAGKTSLIVAMLLELLNNPAAGFPNALELVDSRFESLKRQKILYQKGWKIEKTQPQSVKDSFNASVRLGNRNGKGEFVVLTFVDIAGELCLNADKEFDSEAIKKYPLIDRCNLYLFCTCLSDKGFEKDGGKPIDEGIFKIIDGIEQAFARRRESIPPIGIVFTKADIVEVGELGRPVKENPFRKIAVEVEYFEKGKEMLSWLVRLYDMYHGRQEFDKPSEYVCKLFQDYQEKTYMSIFYCSATGRKTDQLDEQLEVIPQNFDEQGKEIHFKSANVDVLLWWILRVVGCVPTKEKGAYCCHDVPLYGEAFDVGDLYGMDNEQVRQVWPWNKWKERTEAVYSLFLNQSGLDKKLANAVRAEKRANPVMCFLNRFSGDAVERKNLKEVKKYIRNGVV